MVAYRSKWVSSDCPPCLSVPPEITLIFPTVQYGRQNSELFWGKSFTNTTEELQVSFPKGSHNGSAVFHFYGNYDEQDTSLSLSIS